MTHNFLLGRCFKRRVGRLDLYRFKQWSVEMSQSEGGFAGQIHRVYFSGCTPSFNSKLRRSA
jgi:hypothetical protein